MRNCGFLWRHNWIVGMWWAFLLVSAVNLNLFTWRNCFNSFLYLTFNREYILLPATVVSFRILPSEVLYSCIPFQFLSPSNASITFVCLVFFYSRCCSKEEQLTTTNDTGRERKSTKESSYLCLSSLTLEQLFNVMRSLWEYISKWNRD